MMNSAQRELTNTGQGEDVLDDDRSAHQQSQVPPCVGHHRDQGVLDRMDVPDPAGGEAFGERGPDVVLPDHLQQLVPCVPGQAGCPGEPQDDRRQEELLDVDPGFFEEPCDPAYGWYPSEDGSQEYDGDGCYPEVRRGRSNDR